MNDMENQKDSSATPSDTEETSVKAEELVPEYMKDTTEEQQLEEELTGTVEDTSLVSSDQPTDEEDDDDDLPVVTHVQKFSDKQIKIIQIILGLLSGAVIWLAIGFGSASDNVLLQYLFVIVFAAIMLIRRMLENKWQINTRVFVKFWLISLLICLVIFVIYGVATGAFTKQS
ncbi:MAG: hypothetical protein VB082_00610 [Christensenella sp.]|nr:hypothetical protein [Christensenella sp.]